MNGCLEETMSRHFHIACLFHADKMSKPLFPAFASSDLA
jgi:hypothetical protein